MRAKGGVLAILSGVMMVCMASPGKASILITVNKSVQQMSVSVDGVRRYTWPVSTGRSGYGTPSGSYSPFRMEVDHYSKEWDDAPMPHSIFFTAKGHAIHGSYEIGRLGSAVSHGCVRLSPGNAAKLFALVKEEGLANTKVVLTGQAPPMIARRPAQGEAVREPLELQQYEQPYAASSPYPPYETQPRYQPQPQYQRQYAVQPQYQQQYAVQPRYRQPEYAQPYERQPAYGQQVYPGGPSPF